MLAFDSQAGRLAWHQSRNARFLLSTQRLMKDDSYYGADGREGDWGTRWSSTEIHYKREVNELADIVRNVLGHLLHCLAPPLPLRLGHPPILQHQMAQLGYLSAAWPLLVARA